MNGLTRRGFVTSAALTCLPVRTTFASEGAITLSWKDLRHPEDLSAFERMQTRVDHSANAPAAVQPSSIGARPEWHGKRVRVSGFVLPIKRTPDGIEEFILASFVPPCIHVPPPAANQLIMVSTKVPHKTRGAFEAVEVTGIIKAETVSEGRSEIAYTMVADQIERLDEIRRPDQLAQREQHACKAGALGSCDLKA